MAASRYQNAIYILKHVPIHSRVHHSTKFRHTKKANRMQGLDVYFRHAPTASRMHDTNLKNAPIEMHA